ncbi:MAG: cell wall hydrolase, partial [Spirochaetia bacterium]|nr:cell wall hydrolase [Spirochaetia bacterium]
MKRFIIITLLMLLLLILAVFLMPAAEAPAKEVPEISFEDQVKSMIREHKIMTERLIRYMEHQKESIDLLAEVIYWENWHTDKEHLAAYYTGAVVMNRVNSKAWPNTVKEVLYQKGQYSTTKLFYTKEIPQECYDMARDIYKNG